MRFLLIATALGLIPYAYAYDENHFPYTEYRSFCPLPDEQITVRGPISHIIHRETNPYSWSDEYITEEHYEKLAPEIEVHKFYSDGSGGFILENAHILSAKFKVKWKVN